MADQVAIDLDSIDSLATQLSSLPQGSEAIENVDIETLQRGKYQPRHDIDIEKLKELSRSIKSQGVIQPIVARPLPEGLEIVAGERRWRAAKMAGLQTIPCVIRTVTDQAAMAMALIENIDREDMSLADESAGVARLVQETSAKKAAQILGKPQQWVSKRVRISKAPQYMIDFMKIGYSTDTEGFYLLARLAEQNEAAAKKLINQWEADPTVRMSLRAQVLNLQKGSTAKSKTEAEQDIEPSPPLDESADEQTEQEQPEDKKPTKKSKTEGKPKAAPKQELPPIVIKTAEKTGNILVLNTNEGSINFELSKGAAASIIKALKKKD